ncbi:MAG: chromate efflux transporter [Proteobacteria bacterium]|nr:chromate efflux transporter [Pseudomonadota bacterium]MBU1594494.1 chromate efflux transporter [Pseudomonadota bacterium]
MSVTAPPFREFFRYWLRLGFINFGGPAGQIAMMHKDLVDARGWVEERLFQRALGFCMLLPGPEAHQLAVYLGWRMHGQMGGAVAGLFFLLPSVGLMLLLSWLAAAHGGVPLVAGVFRGVAGAVVAIVAQAVWRIGKKALRHQVFYAFAAASFLMGYVLRLKFPGIVAAAGLMGLWLGQARPDIFCPRGVCLPEDPAAPPAAPPLRHVGRVAALGACLWLAVALPVHLLAEPGSLLPKILNFYSKASFVTFGGAYAVLSYVSDMAMRLGWVGQEQLVLGLGLAETTPGPLIMVTQFVGFLTAWNHPGALQPLAAGILGGLLTTFGMFLPSFLLVFAGAPYIEALTANPRLQSMLTGITAAVVGVILKLGVVFATATFWPARLGGGPDPFALAVAAACGCALWRWNTGVHILVLAAGAAGAAWSLLG